MPRVSDLASGLAVAGLGVAIFLKAQTFPAVGGVAAAPSFYPGMIGAVLVALGLALAAGAIIRRSAFPLAGRIEWFRRPANLVAVLAVPAAIILYGVLGERIGFIAACLLVATGLLLAFRVRPATSAVLGLGVTLMLHLIFAKLLRVPLPYGFVEMCLP